MTARPNRTNLYTILFVVVCLGFVLWGALRATGRAAQPVSHAASVEPSSYGSQPASCTTTMEEWNFCKEI